MNNQFAEKFIEESEEIFGQLENDLVALESNPENDELINTIFRGLHTLKGSGAMFGFQHLSSFAHEVEALFDTIRTGKLGVTPEIISLSLEACDFLRYLRDITDYKEEDLASELKFTHAIKAFLSATSPQEIPELRETPPEKTIKGRRAVYRIRYMPDQTIFTIGINPVVLLNNLGQLGKCFVHCDKEALPTIREINPEQCYLTWTCILVTNEDINAIRDVFIFAENAGTIDISEIFSNDEEILEERIPFIGEILLQKGDITAPDLERVLGNRMLFGEKAVAMGATSEEKIATALFEQDALRTVKKEIASHTVASTIRVQNEKLDILTNTVSELVTLQARLTQFASAKKESELTSIAEYLEKLTSSLRDTVMIIRMVPVEEGFSTMHRLVRDLAKELGKEVKLSITGGDTEIDKAVMDNLKDPMMHLVRNCIDHGLESPETRKLAGKPADGQILIKAEHMGSHVIISVTDDGKGLDAEKIFAKAVEKGLATSSDTLDESDIFQFIFLPGFSTAQKTTAISGRGVGMDVVKRNIEAIRGEVSIESEKGKGTTIRMKLPITLAIIDGLLFTVGEELFVINIAMVSECLELTPEIKLAAGGQNILKLRESIIPFVHLRDLLTIPGDAPDHEQIIIMSTSDQTIGFVVDSVQGKHQTVVKPTGRLFAAVREVTGATILGDGRIALILDANALVQKVTTLHNEFVEL